VPPFLFALQKDMQKNISWCQNMLFAKSRGERKCRSAVFCWTRYFHSAKGGGMIETGKTEEAIDAKTGWPEQYYAVIFTAQRSLSGDNMYEITADRMVALAQQQPGFLGVEAVSGDDGIGITVSYWTDRDAITQWRGHAEHMVSQAMGRQEFYDWYRIRIAEVVSERVFMSR
jgi:heme-degrading monooxygenase HmoA